MKKIVIIGGGPAGLTAAYELLKGGECEVTVLEASDTLGGISRTVQHNGNRMDIGGHRFFSKDERIMKWWAELMPVQGKPSFDDRVLGHEKPFEKNGGDPECEDNIMLLRNRTSRIYYKKAFFDYPVTMNMNTIKNMGLMTTARAGFSYIYSCAHKLPETNLENFYINRFGRVLYSMFFEGYTEKLWGRHPREISADWGAQRVKGLSITAILKDMLSKVLGTKTNENAETSLIEQFWYPKYGPGQLWELVGQRVTEMGGKILYGREVTEIKTVNERVTSVKCGEEEFLADEFISSMPIKDLVNGMKADKNIQRIANGLPYRDFVTVGLLVNRLKLKNKTNKRTLGNIVPDCWIYVQDKGVKLGRIQIFNNWSPYMVADPVGTVWIGLEYFCDEGDRFWNMSEKECVDFAVKELRKMGVIGKDAVIDSHREKVRKAYPAYFDTYAEFDKVRHNLDSYENLWCVGRNGQHRYNNMDHSMMTAIEAVKAINNGKVDKSAIWNVNTEKEYHEQRKDNRTNNKVTVKTPVSVGTGTLSVH
ncbi:MAG: NAD(P)/FAD-dependent oxidoreductase [Ruminococcus sp.]|uniref:NAD(P)/FAD-dependent oxidoreductase n=1 Tax=Ruminococcus sp. TaxID=41978 RepID=UPI0025D23D4D|nr:NAD(P)/FAD-dependent oxidoreductase [Ruminococcus sp.]MCR5540844.1 NAD(P)/FAD-dependent oxidoreductase [Ruminococcus sp.]